MKNLRQRKALRVAATFLAFCFAQVYVHGALPGSPTNASVPQRQITARLTTKNNQPINVNGNPVGTGATLLTGVTIETPDQVSATIDLGDAGVVELQPNSKIQLDFDENGNVRVKVIRGCAVAKKKTNVLPGEIEIYTDTASEKTNKKRRHMGFCILPNGGLSPFNVGLTGVQQGGLYSGIGGGIILAVLLNRGSNPSPAR